MEGEGLLLTSFGEGVRYRRWMGERVRRVAAACGVGDVPVELVRSTRRDLSDGGDGGNERADFVVETSISSDDIPDSGDGRPSRADWKRRMDSTVDWGVG